MKKQMKWWRVVGMIALAMGMQQSAVAEVRNAAQVNRTTVELRLDNGMRRSVDFYGENIFRVFQDPQGGIIRDPKANPPAEILVKNPRKEVKNVSVSEKNGHITIATEQIAIDIDKATELMKVTDLRTGAVVMQETAPVTFDEGKASMKLKAGDKEYFYGGGMQNGRFSHRGEAIQILNSNNWVDGGVASPAPFYWSTNGYGIMWYTFNKGVYDFGKATEGEVALSHETDYLDVFVMVDATPAMLLGDFYQLTGNPVLLPKFGFYEGHLNAYNRDYWTETKEGGVLFEDGKRYRESQKNDGKGIKESLNGELNNYQFSARAVVDRYLNNDMPLGWVLPNDGYGAGYGQTETLEGNVENLRQFGEYARSKGVEIGLWTQSDLHPREGVSALLQRDIVREVRDAGVRVLKTDVAWVGAGYSFGLNGVSDVGQIMPYYGNDARPFIITLDGWAGTQRYAGLWSGDQTGGNWEYIRFHIPTYIGSGLAGQPNVSSDMDGIFGGRNVPVNVRDFQWKTFTPMQLNMDGWGANEKYPQALGEPAASINRSYLKWKSALLPYTYSIAREAVEGLPMVRAMFLQEANPYTLGSATKYQFLYGPDFLVAPIYQETKADEKGNDVRNGIYLPEGWWVDFYTGESYKGGCIVNNFAAPLWKLPVFVKAGAIVPMTTPNNSVAGIDKKVRIYDVYPYGETSFTEYDDDGVSQAYLYDECAETEINSKVEKERATLTIGTMKGEFKGMEKNKRTEVRMYMTQAPKKVRATMGGHKVKLVKAESLDEYNQAANAYYFEAEPELNQFSTKGSEAAEVSIKGAARLLVKVAETDVTANEVQVVVDGYRFNTANALAQHTGALQAPVVSFAENAVQPYTLTPSWKAVQGADYYEIMFNDMLYSTITDTELLFEELEAETDYSFKVRAVNAEGTSEWATATVKTLSNPLEFAIADIQAETSCPNQGGQGLKNLFDFDVKTVWHTIYSGNSVPFTMDIDLRGVSPLDKLVYMPREDAGNGTIMRGTLSYSKNKKNWSEPIEINWAGDNTAKIINFEGNPQVRYIRINVTEARGNFGSGREMFIFKVADSETVLQGDINYDKRVDMDDFTSYMNYTGLRAGDSDFDGYISGGDINENGMIDAYDISVVGTVVRGGVRTHDMKPLAGNLRLVAPKTIHEGEEVKVQILGENLESVNAFSLAIPYDAKQLQFVSTNNVGTKDMENLTYDRLHTNGVKALYPTFVNTGNKQVLSGSEVLVEVTFKALKSGKLNLEMKDMMLVDKKLNTIE